MEENFTLARVNNSPISNMSFSQTVHYYWTVMADPRTNDWPLVGSPGPILTILFIYLYFVLKLGPRYMESKEPYNLKVFIKFLNIFQIVANVWIIQGILDAGWIQDIWIYCTPSDYSYNPGPYKLAKVMWWTLLVKLADLVETGVFVLRKKQRQVSFLHLYHHVSTLIIQWLSTKYIATGMSLFIVLLNCAVHVIMYTYYLFSTFGPRIREKIVPFKPLLTVIQMAQFIIMIVYSIESLMPSCPVPKFPGPLMIGNLLINFSLFYNFYRNTYMKPKRKSN